MNVLFDTNVVLDLLLDRKPFVFESTQLFSLVEIGQLNGFLCATTITTVEYLATKLIGAKSARIAINNLMKLFEIAPVNRVVIETAIKLNFADFEDAVIHESANHMGITIITTRDLQGFKKATLNIYSPKELLKLLTI